MLWLNWLLDRFEPPLQNIEDEYRKYYLQADIVQAMLVYLMVFVTAFVFIPSDYLLFQQSRMFYTLLGARFTFGISTLLFIVILRRVTEPTKYDQLTFVWMIVALLFSTWVD